MEIRSGVAAVALVLAACGTETTAADNASEVPVSPVASSETAASPAPAPPKGDKPTREFIVGNWGTDGDCTLAMDLRADGTSDGPFGDWLYSDGVISFADTPEVKVTVTVVDDNTMESNNASGKTSTMTRCP